MINANFKNKNIVITGAKGQLGSQLVESFKKAGANVFGVDIEDFDITCESDVENYFKDMFEKHKFIDVLINNAGVSTFEPFLERSKEDFRRVSDVNLWGTFNCIKNFVKNFDNADQRSASIINVGSLYGSVSPDPRIYIDCERRNSEIYGATKAGIAQMTKYFSVHLASKNIRVNCVSPGGIFNPESPQGSEFIKAYSLRCPMNKMADTENLVPAFLLFASDDSEYITGQNLVVDGGFTSW